MSHRLVGFVALSLFAGTATATSLALQIVPARGVDAEGVVASVSFEARGENLRKPIEFELTVGETRRLDLPVDSEWFLWAEAPGFWIEKLLIRVPADRQMLSLELSPGGELSGVLVFEDRKLRRRELELRLLPPGEGGRNESRRHRQVFCRFDEAEWRCPAPTGLYDLVFDMNGYAPIHRWGVAVDTGATQTLRLLNLRRGATLWGRVAIETGEPLPEETRVALATARETEGGVEAIRVRARPDTQGRFQFIGVQPGEYTLVSADPEFVVVPRPALEVTRESPRDVEMDPLVLYYPAEVALVFLPPLAPFQERWQFELTLIDPDDGAGLASVSAAADEAGFYSLPRVPPGTYRFNLAGRVPADWYEMTIDVLAGDPPLEVLLRIIGIEGRVSFGREPLAAGLRFRRSRHSDEITLESDELGLFEGLLPADGVWNIAIEAEAAEVDFTLEEVDVVAPLPSRVATLELRLPGTRLSGIVVDLFGDPVADATVKVRIQDGFERKTRKVETDEDGNFVIVGLPAGAVSIRAEGENRRRGTWLQVYLEEDETADPIVLRLNSGLD